MSGDTWKKEYKCVGVYVYFCSYFVSVDTVDPLPFTLVPVVVKKNLKSDNFAPLFSRSDKVFFAFSAP